MSVERVEREIARLQEGGQNADLVFADRWYVIYRRVPTAGARLSLPVEADVIVPVPEGYPAAVIDLAGLPANSPLLPRLKGGQNNQGQVSVSGVEWQLASYHPHNGGGGPPWDPAKHGFDTYLDHVIAWLGQLA